MSPPLEISSPFSLYPNLSNTKRRASAFGVEPEDVTGGVDDELEEEPPRCAWTATAVAPAVAPADLELDCWNLLELTLGIHCPSILVTHPPLSIVWVIPFTINSIAFW